MVLSLWNGLTWAAVQAAATPPVGADGKTPPQTGLPPTILMFTVIIILFYFIMLRPQKAEQRKRQEMIDSMAKGDTVLTNGGIYGTIESVDKEKGIVTVTIAPKVSIKFARSAVTSITKKKGESETSAAE